MAFCPNCGAQLQDGAQFCPNCGTALAGGATPAGGAPQMGAPVQQVSQPNISIEILKRAFAVILKKPLRLWGLSLLSVVLIGVGYLIGGPVPLIGIVASYVFSVGMAWVYLDGYRGQEVSVDQVFEGFQNTKHVAFCMGWADVLVLLWSLIPVVGPIFAIIKTYSYSLVPYIIREDNTRKMTDVARESKARTEGFKGKMFLTDFLIYIIIFGVFLVLGLLSQIPAIGGFFVFLMVIAAILLLVFLPLFCGLVRAAWYEEIMRRRG